MQTTQDVVDMKATSNRFNDLFDRQKAYFNTNITKSYEWRIDQLDRLSRMLSESMGALSEAVGSDFKTALSESRCAPGYH
jgi:aldehyde dehydrogenase (NAD+)